MSRPSLVRLAFRSFLLLFGAIMLFVGSILLFIAGSDVRTAREYEATGRRAQGEVIRKDLRRATSNTSTSYELTYRFGSAGRALERTESVDVHVWEAVEPGHRVEVEYLPGNGGSVRLAGRDGSGSWIAAAVGGGIALVGAVLFSIGGRALVRRWRIYRTGTSAPGTVTDVRETNVRVNNRTQWAVHYTYRDHVGQTRTGDSGPLPPGEAQEWQQGDTGLVRFDPERPERSVWVGKE